MESESKPKLESLETLAKTVRRESDRRRKVEAREGVSGEGLGAERVEEGEERSGWAAKEERQS